MNFRQTILVLTVLLLMCLAIVSMVYGAFIVGMAYERMEYAAPDPVLPFDPYVPGPEYLPPSPDDEVTSPDPYDMLLITRTVYAEAAGESLLGKLAVASVVVNRKAHPDYPASIEDVVFQPNAFAVGSRLWEEAGEGFGLPGIELKAYEDCVNVAYVALTGGNIPHIIAFKRVGTETDGYFATLSRHSIIDNHEFFTDGVSNE